MFLSFGFYFCWPVNEFVSVVVNEACWQNLQQVIKNETMYKVNVKKGIVKST